MARKLDLAQQNAVNVLNNAVVSAGAGSGKTTVLAERFAHLVMNENYNVDEILTLTFTKKATVEMKGRIFNTLKNAAEKLDNENAKKAVRHFNTAQIKTLDSYCSEIAKQGARFYGITPGFTQDKDKAEQAIKDMALPFFLENRDDESIQALTKTMNFNDIAEEFFVKSIIENSTIANPIEFKKDLDRQVIEIVKAWKTEVKNVESIINEMSKILTKGTISEKTSTYQNLKKAIENRYQDEDVVLTEEIVRKSNSEILEKYIQTQNAFFNIKKPGRCSGDLATIKILLNDFQEKFHTLLSIANYVSSYRIAEKSALLLEKFQAKVNKAKRVSGILTFKDVSELAIRILKEHPEIRLIEKNKFKAIMIDEFQDNNELQKDLLFMISEKIERKEQGVPSIDEILPQKLFFVGDEKQSIYRFRGADVSVFRQLKDDIKGEDGSGNLDMKMNYRSDAELISSFNTFFGGIPYPIQNQEENTKMLPSIFMTQKYAQKNNMSIPNYEAEYNEVLTPDFKVEKANYENRKTHIALYLDKKAENDNESVKAIENEAYFVASEIKKYITGEKLVSTVVKENIDGKEVSKIIQKKINASDIAILLKTTTTQPIFERMLLSFGIPYSTEIFKGFFNDGPVNDIIDFLSLCVYPQDTNSYAQLLCSPFVNLSTNTMQEIIANKILTEKAENIFKEPFDVKDLSFLKKEEKKRFLEAKEIFEEIRNSSKTEPISETINKLWYKYGYRYETLWNRDVNMYSTLYDMLFELARKADDNAQSIATFVDDIKIFVDEQESVENLDIPLETRDSVKIMSIHKSKGLEFPVVFIPAIANKGKGDRNDSAIFISKRFGAVINTPPCNIASKIEKKGNGKSNYFYNLMKDENDAKASAELRRLTYVAFTRAENELYITGTFNGSFDPSTKSKKSTSEIYLPGIPHTNISGTSFDYEVPNTIYKLLMPILDFYEDKQETTSEDITGAQENDDIIFKEAAPFDFINIAETSRTSIFSKKDTLTRVNNEIEKRLLIENLEKQYKKAEIIEKDFIPKLYIQPTNLHIDDDETVKSRRILSFKEAPFQEINQLVESSIPKSKKDNLELEFDFVLDFEESTENSTEENVKAIKPEFKFSDFGSIAHSFMEAAINETEPVIHNANLMGLHGSETKIEKVKDICKVMQKQFISSDLGKRAKASTWKRTEYEFRSRINYQNEEGMEETKIIRGSMDLVFSEIDSSGQEKFVIVDYKSNQKMNFEIYVAQLACYKQALSKILHTDSSNISCILYYLRFDKMIDITTQCDKIDLSKALKELDL